MGLVMVCEDYEVQVVLFVCLFLYVVKEKVFVFKGGMVINLFYCDLFCLLVDIDLIYLLIKDCGESFVEINEVMDCMVVVIEGSIVGVKM